MDMNYTEQNILCRNYDQVLLYIHAQSMSYMSRTSANHAIVIMHS